jgi:tRNA G46 methylase TrmB
MKNRTEFSFAKYASDFDRHITTSIRGYKDLRSDCVSFSQYFIQDNTRVLDIGCSSGALLQTIRKRNEKKHPSVEYIGLDIEKGFKDHWLKRRAPNLKFKQLHAQKPIRDPALVSNSQNVRAVAQ